MRKITLEDRCICIDGVKVIQMNRVGNDSAGHNIAPWDMDKLTRMIVRLLDESMRSPDFVVVSQEEQTFINEMEVEHRA